MEPTGVVFALGNSPLSALLLRCSLLCSLRSLRFPLRSLRLCVEPTCSELPYSTFHSTQFSISLCLSACPSLTSRFTYRKPRAAASRDNDPSSILRPVLLQHHVVRRRLEHFEIPRVCAQKECVRIAGLAQRRFIADRHFVGHRISTRIIVQRDRQARPSAE